MAIPESHIQSKKAIRKYSGESFANGIVRWLNECRDAEAQKRVRRLINAITQAADASQSLPPLDENGESERNRNVRRFDALVGYVNRLLKPYRATLLAYASYPIEGGAEVRFDWKPIDKWSSIPRGVDEFGAVWSILSLGSDFLRVRPCRCGKVFYARFEHQKFCSEACRLKFYRDDPKWKSYRAEKAKSYYWLHKNKNVK